MARTVRRQADIFNFSFLDILACTVGALTFILVLFIVTGLGDVATDPEVKDLQAELQLLRQEVATLEQTVTTLEQTVAKLTEEHSRQQQRLDAAQKQLATAEEQLRNYERELAEAETQQQKFAEALTDSRWDDLKNQADLSPQLAALSQEVRSMQADVTLRTAELKELRNETLNRETLIARRQELESENRKLEETLSAGREELANNAEESTQLAEEAEAAENRRPELLAKLAPLRQELKDTQATRELIEQELSKREADSEAKRSSAKNLRLIVLLLTVLAAILICLLYWLIVLHNRSIAPLLEWSEKVKDAKAKRQELQRELSALSEELKRTPASPEEAAANQRELLAELQREIEESRQQAKEAQQQTAELEQQVQTETREAQSLANQARQAQIEARKNATPVDFRIPYYQKTSKKGSVVDCFRGRVARVTTTDGLDEDYYKLDLVKSTALTKATGKTTVVLERHGSGEMADSWAAKRFLNDIDSRKHFLMLLVRPSGFEAFRAIREQAWNQNIEVGWEPFEEDMPIMSSGEGGGGGGIQ